MLQHSHQGRLHAEYKYTKNTHKGKQKQKNIKNHSEHSDLVPVKLFQKENMRKWSQPEQNESETIGQTSKDSNVVCSTKSQKLYLPDDLLPK